MDPIPKKKIFLGPMKFLYKGEPYQFNRYPDGCTDNLIFLIIEDLRIHESKTE